MRMIGRIGAVCFAAWALLHVVGSAWILLALGDGPDSGFAVYQLAGSGYDQLASKILGYFAYMLLWVAGLVMVVAARFNWHNNQTALALNSAVILLVEVGLAVFLLIPGHVGLLEALPGMALFVAAVVLGGIGCNGVHGSQARELSG